MFFKGRQKGRAHDGRVKILILLLAWVVTGWAEEENSAQRLENAQKGMAEGSWPRRPENRISGLSGKMKEIPQISPKSYGQDREFRTKTWGDSGKLANPLSSPGWQVPDGRRWDEARWKQAGEWADRETRNEKFQPSVDSRANRLLSYRELGQDPSPDWSTRSSSLGVGRDGSWRRYEGKLTRVREQVAREDKSVRDLGAGRQEKFSPEEVEKILAEPPGGMRGEVTGQSATASRLSAGGN